MPKKRLSELGITEKSVDVADSAETVEPVVASSEPAKSTDSASTKWESIVQKLKTYDGRFTNEGYPYTQDLERCIDTDLTPDQVCKIWDKFKQENTNE